MDAEIKAKWVTALRSGDYKQGTSVLESVDGKFCCLGVLCRVMGLAPHPTMTMTSPLTLKMSIEAKFYDGAVGMPTDKALKAAGLSDADAALLSNMNDTGSTFDGIAKHIEAHL